VAKGLDYIHRKLNIIHTDLKPENICLLRDDMAVLQDTAHARWQDLQVPPTTEDGEPLPEGLTDVAAPLTKNQKKRAKKRAAAEQAARENGGVVPNPADKGDEAKPNQPTAGGGEEGAECGARARLWFPDKRELPAIPRQDLGSVDAMSG